MLTYGMQHFHFIRYLNLTTNHGWLQFGTNIQGCGTDRFKSSGKFTEDSCKENTSQFECRLIASKDMGRKDICICMCFRISLEN